MELLRSMSNATQESPGPLAEPCIIVIFGAAGDLTKRLLMPALYNLTCEGLLPEQFAIIGLAREDFTTADFRARMARELRTFSTRKDFNADIADNLCKRLHYLPGEFGDSAAFARLRDLVTKLDAEVGARGNILFYLATPPSVFGLISGNLDKAGFK